MFKNMKLGTKIAGGFAIVLVLTAVVGYVGFSGVSGMSTSSEKAIDCNNMVIAVNNARCLEKDFIIDNQAEDVQKAEEKITELQQLVKSTRAKMTADSDRALMDDAATDTGKYKEALNLYVDLAAKKDAAAQEMRTAGVELEELARKIMTSQEADYKKVAQESQATLDDHLWKAESGARILRLAQECRENEQAYVLNRDKKLIDAVHNLTDEVVELASAVKAKCKEKANIELTEKAIASAELYRKDFDTYVAYREQEQAAAEKMAKAANVMVDAAKAFEEAEKADLAKLVDTAVNNAAIKAKLEKTQACTEVVALALQARKNEKNFLLKGDDEYIQNVQEAVDQIIALGKKLQTLSKKPQNAERAATIIDGAKTYDEGLDELVAAQQRAEALLQSAEGYKQAFAGYVESNSKMNQANVSMVDAAKILQQVAEQINVEQKKKYANVREDSQAKLALNKGIADAANTFLQQTLVLRSEINVVLC